MKALGLVLSGTNNKAIGTYDTVSGGVGNEALDEEPAVFGGFANKAKGNYALISGGELNIAKGELASIDGGSANETQGEFASISGGEDSKAIGKASSVFGGLRNEAIGILSWVGGGNENKAQDNYSSMLGVVGRETKAKKKSRRRSHLLGPPLPPRRFRNAAPGMQFPRWWPVPTGMGHPGVAWDELVVAGEGPVVWITIQRIGPRRPPAPRRSGAIVVSRR